MDDRGRRVGGVAPADRPDLDVDVGHDRQLQRRGAVRCPRRRPGQVQAHLDAREELTLESDVEAGGQVHLEGERGRPADNRVQLDEAVHADNIEIGGGLEPAAELEGVAGEGDVRLSTEPARPGGDRSMLSRCMLASSAGGWYCGWNPPAEMAKSGSAP